MSWFGLHVETAQHQCGMTGALFRNKKTFGIANVSRQEVMHFKIMKIFQKLPTTDWVRPTMTSVLGYSDF